jgi:uncharacterized membrane protein YeaQ/YmgE (transglycosylase-associated protein family)
MGSVIGWLVIGLLAGGFSGLVVGVRSVQGCLPTIVIGILGAVVGGWLVEQMGFGQTEGFVGAVIVATLGGIIVRVVLRSLERH